MSDLELVFDYFEDHVRVAAQVNERRPIFLGLFCYVLGGVSLYVAQALAQRLYVLPYSWSFCALAVLWELGAGFLLAAALHLIVELGGAAGSAASLFVLLGMAELSWSLAVPLVLLARLFFRESSLAVTVALLAVAFWSLTLKARSLRDNYHIGLGRAWLSLGLPYFAAAVLAVLAFSLALIGLIVKFMQAVP